jgi:hypothetical protein
VAIRDVKSEKSRATPRYLSDSAPIETGSAFWAWANRLPHCNRNTTACFADFSWPGTTFAINNNMHKFIS